MPPRPCPSRFLRPVARRPCLAPATPRTALFHTPARRDADVLANHYETLELPATASAADVKRQFYTLSKKNHPDHNRDDPGASTRFVAISEAYHTLSVPEKRRQYDAQLEQADGRARAPGSPQGSYSSAAYGSRPASGLTKKRSTFCGPPPSFYKSGGYGEHSAKREHFAYANAHQAHEHAPAEQVPHFDGRKHKDMHDTVNEHIWARRRKMQTTTVRFDDDYKKGDMVVNFLAVSGVIGAIGMTLVFFGDRSMAKHEKNA
ncbi:hypothetical protein ACEQ8H_001930 [Pleosporales sp. CAS-2024a]